MARLAGDSRLGLDASALNGILENPIDFVGAAPAQAATFVASVETLAKTYPEAAGYNPEEML